MHDSNNYMEGNSDIIRNANGRKILRHFRIVCILYNLRIKFNLFLTSRLVVSSTLIFQVEFQRLLPFIHDDLPYSLRRVDRAAMGLHESWGESRGWILLCNFSTSSRHGQFYGTQLVLGVVAQQFQQWGIEK